MDFHSHRTSSSPYPFVSSVMIAIAMLAGSCDLSATAGDDLATDEDTASPTPSNEPSEATNEAMPPSSETDDGI